MFQSAADATTEPVAQAPTNFADSVAFVQASIAELWGDFLTRLPLLVAGLIVILLTWVVAHIVRYVLRRILERSRLRTSFQDLMLQLAYVTAWIVGLLVACIVAFPGMTPAKALTVLGLGSVAIGFAFKDIFENFFAGILILWKFPFDRGDFITCNSVEGKVEDISIRMTNIRQVDGQLVVVPNAMLLKEAVNVLTSYKTRRLTVICGVAYGEDVDESRDVIREAVASCETVDSNHPIEIFAQEFASSSINFEVTWWTGSKPIDIRRSRDEVVSSVKRALDAHGIEIPFPYRTLTFKEPLSLTRHRSQNGEPNETESPTEDKLQEPSHQS